MQTKLSREFKAGLGLQACVAIGEYTSDVLPLDPGRSTRDHGLEQAPGVLIDSELDIRERMRLKE